MDIHFVAVSALQIREHYPSYSHEKGRYFKAIKDGKTLCLYGIISRNETTGEAFLMMQTFQGKVLSKEFFMALFDHAFSLGYKEVWTWTKWDRLIKLFARFEGLGITKTDSPFWDETPFKTWFIKRI
jgi:hypothetical protein